MSTLTDPDAGTKQNISTREKLSFQLFPLFCTFCTLNDSPPLIVIIMIIIAGFMWGDDESIQLLVKFEMIPSTAVARHFAFIKQKAPAQKDWEQHVEKCVHTHTHTHTHTPQAHTHTHMTHRRASVSLLQEEEAH
jgi:hypothetical protein